MKNDPKSNRTTTDKNSAYVNFGYLKELTLGNREGMIVMLQAYLEETPKLLGDLKRGIENNDWAAVKNAAHSMLPSFPMLGMEKRFEEMARKIQDLAARQEEPKEIKKLFSELELVCGKAMEELETELSTLEKK